MNAAPAHLSPLAAGLALGRFNAPTEHVTELEHSSLATWFAALPASAVQRFTARVSGPPSWRITQVALDAENRIVAARWLEAPQADRLVARLHPQDSFVWWQE